MINQPTTILAFSFQEAWKQVLVMLSQNRWELYNLVVQVADPSSFDQSFHTKVSSFCDKHSLLGPKHVAYTVFPHQLYQTKGSVEAFFEAYNKPNGLYDRLHRRHGREWGTYFRRMTHYESASGQVVNQLGEILRVIKGASRVQKAAYTVAIQKPGTETIRRRGAPCLNYLAVQMERTSAGPLLGLLSVYRNHDFLNRAYGNYWGLCNLCTFLAKESEATAGPVTVVSSHAYVDKSARLVNSLLCSL